MDPLLLIDFGSTYTKLTALDLDEERILGRSQAFTTAASDIKEGLDLALERLEASLGRLDYRARLASSSAAGGLAMMVSGLVPELTAEAARMAALGAGAKIVRLFSYELNREDLDFISQSPPDIFLLTGGTDGGNREVITANAAGLAGLPVRFPVIYAGNRNALDDCRELLADFPLTVCPNVMPRFGQLNILDVQREIRALFLSRIVKARGLSKARELLSGILMPTPSALLSAMELLALGTGEEAGMGDLLAIDVGGATTDVYSMAKGEPQNINVIHKGFEEPYAKRTVEGDIGVRYSLEGIVQDQGLETLAREAGMSPGELTLLLEELEADRSRLPLGDQDQLLRLDQALAAGAVDMASRRHAGQLEEVYTPTGLTYLQTGKDLRGLGTLILTGGCLAHGNQPLAMARRALYSRAHPLSLRPEAVQVLVDRSYILAAMGVLADRYPEAALRIMKKELVKAGQVSWQR